EKSAFFLSRSVGSPAMVSHVWLRWPLRGVWLVPSVTGRRRVCGLLRTRKCRGMRGHGQEATCVFPRVGDEGMAPPTALYQLHAITVGMYCGMCLTTRPGAGTGFLCSVRSLAGLVLTLEKIASAVTINLHLVKFDLHLVKFITFREAVFLASFRPSI
ncbi:unnamed protein product, partial [Ectocarpus sp. 6 AP-2014]